MFKAYVDRFIQPVQLKYCWLFFSLSIVNLRFNVLYKNPANFVNSVNNDLINHELISSMNTTLKP